MVMSSSAYNASNVILRTRDNSTKCLYRWIYNVSCNRQLFVNHSHSYLHTFASVNLAEKGLTDVIAINQSKLRSIQSRFTLSENTRANDSSKYFKDMRQLASSSLFITAWSVNFFSIQLYLKVDESFAMILVCMVLRYTVQIFVYSQLDYLAMDDMGTFLFFLH